MSEIRKIKWIERGQKSKYKKRLPLVDNSYKTVLRADAAKMIEKPKKKESEDCSTKKYYDFKEN